MIYRPDGSLLVHPISEEVGCGLVVTLAAEQNEPLVLVQPNGSVLAASREGQTWLRLVGEGETAPPWAFTLRPDEIVERIELAMEAGRRTERLVALTRELRFQLDVLSKQTPPSQLVSFLDVLARVEGFDETEIQQLGPEAQEAVSFARAARDAHPTEIAAIAWSAVDLADLIHRGWGVDNPEDYTEDLWLRDVLVLATVLPWLPPERHAEIREAVDKAQAIVESDPRRFLSASVLAADRVSRESPDRLTEEAWTFLQALYNLPLLVLVEGG